MPRSKYVGGYKQFRPCSLPLSGLKFGRSSAGEIGSSSISFLALVPNKLNQSYVCYVYMRSAGFVNVLRSERRFRFVTTIQLPLRLPQATK